MKYDIISTNLIDIVNNVTELIKSLSEKVDCINIDGYSGNILVLMDILESIKIIENHLVIDNE